VERENVTVFLVLIRTLKEARDPFGNIVPLHMALIIKENFSMALHGVSGIAVDRNWAETGMRLMNTMWERIKVHKLENSGINVWVYEPGNKMLAGIELKGSPPPESGLTPLKIHLPKYVYYLHTGPYNKIPEAFSSVSREMEEKGVKTCLPYLEIYGHWTPDEAKLETEMLWCLK
jgi:hypothetical protein